MIAPARRAALEALRAIDEEDRTLPDVLARLRRQLSDPRDVALGTEITIGTTRWRATLDHLLAGASSRALDAVDPVVLRVLRLSCYQLLHLDRVPASAIVNDGVALAKTGTGAGAGGFVNAVLRRLADPQRRPPLPARPGPAGRMADWAAYLEVTWSHPAWLVARWLRALGPEVSEARLRHDQAPAATTVRAVTWRNDSGVLRTRLADEQVETAPTRYAPHGLDVLQGNPMATRAARDGALVVQDEGSQLVAAFAAAGGATRVLDVCAAPGGKTTAIADDGGEAALVVAGDVRRRRVRLLRTTVRDTGRPGIHVVAHDGLRGLPYRPVFDLVLVDAPCSGLGTLRRDPDLKWRRREDELLPFAERQRRLLAEAARVVAPGGRLVYATCSSEPEENADVARWFGATHPEFSRSEPAGAWRQPPLADLLGPDGALQTSPEQHGLDLFYAVSFTRQRTR